MKIFTTIRIRWCLRMGLLLILFGFSSSIFAQENEMALFREDWKEIPAETPVTEDHLENEKLNLHLYGAAKQELKKSHHPEIANDPFYIWSGTCDDTWALALGHKDLDFDLRDPSSKIVWRSKQSGFRTLRIILELKDGTWLVSEQGSEATKDWETSSFMLNELSWRKLNLEGIFEGQPVEDPDLSHVVKVGFTDLMRGGGTPASSRLDWIEVHGVAIE
ncbi:hypothetical protein [Pleomorphovibrio marinus]|uniref:hypothetical protein n=1 Tax=Pleomorphovibrio marinus TaxID=2164132 RepID=UPI0013003A01|nr:hypothetical protein [Pleomorphovibrio marinus]